MFLDDKLYNHLQEADIQTKEDIQRVYEELLKMCEAEIRVKLPEGLPQSTKIIKAVLDRIFKSWDLFASRLVKEEHVMAQILTKCNFKGAWLNNEKIKNIYYQL